MTGRCNGAAGAATWQVLVVCEVGCIIFVMWGWRDGFETAEGGRFRGVKHKNKIYMYIYMTKTKLQLRQMVLCFSVKHIFFHQTD